MKQCPIFPLNMTLFPGGRIPLQVFETRYLDMVKKCLKSQHGFIVISIKEGQEVGERPEIYNVGTYAEIVDFETLPSGLFGITAEGQQRVLLSNVQQQNDKLLVADIQYIDAETEQTIPEKYLHLVEILKSIKNNPVIQNLNLNINYKNATEVGCRLSELLPFDIEDKQALLELTDPLERLARVQAILDIMGHDFNIT